MLIEEHVIVKRVVTRQRCDILKVYAIEYEFEV
jgi:hypothetical protein